MKKFLLAGFMILSMLVVSNQAFAKGPGGPPPPRGGMHQGARPMGHRPTPPPPPRMHHPHMGFSINYGYPNYYNYYPNYYAPAYVPFDPFAYQPYGHVSFGFRI